MKSLEGALWLYQDSFVSARQEKDEKANYLGNTRPGAKWKPALVGINGHAMDISVSGRTTGVFFLNEEVDAFIIGVS